MTESNIPTEHTVSANTTMVIHYEIRFPLFIFPSLVSAAFMEISKHAKRVEVIHLNATRIMRRQGTYLLLNVDTYSVVGF